MRRDLTNVLDIPLFDRHFFDGTAHVTRIGSGPVGGKATGLLFMQDVLASRFPHERFPDFEVSIPTLTVVSTQLFDQFMSANNLDALARSGQDDHLIAHAFQRASLPVELTGDLRALVEKVHRPLAVRSSSLLEDALYEPFAGVYETKMIPNNQFDADIRFRKLSEAIKLVWASTFFHGAQSYIRATRRDPLQEKMAVVIQEVVGGRHGNRFYPHVSGVARSFSFYRSGGARPEDGVVNLALGLGKTIVDGGTSWTYSPAYPFATPPYGSVGNLLKQTQVQFWAVNMGQPPEYNPIAETEYLVRANLADAESDQTLRYVASTYDGRSDRVSPGIGLPGPRVLNFAPLLVLEELPLNAVVRTLLAVCQEALEAPVEIEFAVTLDVRAQHGHLGFLQVRPMVVSEQDVELARSDLAGDDVLVASESVMGNGVVESVADIVYVRPDTFDARHTPEIAREIARVNLGLLGAQRPYLLIGFGRWGSSDPWLGIPVEWGQISGARVIVEAASAAMNVELSQGSHFFHNLSSFDVSYFSVAHEREYAVDWSWLQAQPAAAEGPFVRHVQCGSPLVIRVDGRRGRGVILKPR